MIYSETPSAWEEKSWGAGDTGGTRLSQGATGILERAAGSNLRERVYTTLPENHHPPGPQPQMSRKYAIKEVFATLQGEGAQAGSPAVFLRFAGCNLGYDVCPWCDTDWVKAHHVEDVEGTLALVGRAADEGFGGERPGLLLVATGGEPSLQ